MADPGELETIYTPFTAFNFWVEITVPGLSDAGDSESGKPNYLCSASFAECDGLEMTMEPKTIREGGNNGRQIHLAGPVSYGQLALKRGMTQNFDLWDWFDQVLQRGQSGLRASAQVVMRTGDRKEEQVVFELFGCLPVKLKAPTLNAKEGIVAIEEMQIAYERLSLKKPKKPKEAENA